MLSLPHDREPGTATTVLQTVDTRRREDIPIIVVDAVVVCPLTYKSLVSIDFTNSHYNPSTNLESWSCGVMGVTSLESVPLVAGGAGEG